MMLMAYSVMQKPAAHLFTSAHLDAAAAVATASTAAALVAVRLLPLDQAVAPARSAAMAAPVASQQQAALAQLLVAAVALA